MIIFTVRNHTCTIAFTIYCVFHVITIDVDLEDGVEDDTTESHHVTDCDHVFRKMNGSNHRVSNKNKDYLKIARNRTTSFVTIRSSGEDNCESNFE